MLFNSFEFIIFLPVVFFLYWFVFKNVLKAQNLFLMLASYFFYAWWDWRFLTLIRAQSFKYSLKQNQFNVLDYSDTLAYNQLFEEYNYFDKGHLNSEGAKILSELIANDIFEILNNK